MIKIQDYNLPNSIVKLKNTLQSLALLDLIISPEWDKRYYSFNSRWGENEQMGSMRNGCGDEFFVHFSSVGCFIKGLAHDSQLSSWSYEGKYSWNELLNQVPNKFESSLKESAFSIKDISFCYWRENTDKKWFKVDFPHDELDLDDDIDGSDYLLETLNGNPKLYQNYVKNYFEQDIKIELIQSIFNHDILIDDVVKLINSDISLNEIVKEVDEIGFSYKL